jgi:hypothetical protein
MLFIGDNHGAFKTYEHILFKMQHKGNRKGVSSSLQVGDMSVGFSEGNPTYAKNGLGWPPEQWQGHKFIRGNHDDPALCRSHPNYLGDYGFLSEQNIFYVSGGYSIDHIFRIVDVTWWEDEELGEIQMNSAINLYKETKPKIMVSHECPLSMKIDSVTNAWKFDYNSRTEIMLQNMFDIHRPDYWIYGHHHKFLEKDVNGTHFVCLDELINGKINDCIYEIPELEWK